MPINPDTLLQTDKSPPVNLLPWLNHTGSLTDKLRCEAGDARLTVLHQGWHQADWWDRYTLDLADEQVFHREILMQANNKPCWYARTVIPQLTYQINQSFFERLNGEMLTGLIFGNPAVQRQFLFSYPVTSISYEYYWLNESMHNHATVLWARVAEYTVNQTGSFYLIEILLPALPGYSS